MSPMDFADSTDDAPPEAHQTRLIFVWQVGKLRSLTWLDVHNNSMTGDVPPSIAKLGELQYLYLAHEQ